MVKLLSIDLPIIPEANYHFREARRDTWSKLVAKRDLSDQESVSFWEEVYDDEGGMKAHCLGRVSLRRLLEAPLYILINAMLHAWYQRRDAIIPEIHWGLYTTNLFLVTHQPDFNVLPALHERLDNMASQLLCDFFSYLAETKLGTAD
jgi:hypothetical protein